MSSPLPLSQASKGDIQENDSHTTLTQGAQNSEKVKCGYCCQSPLLSQCKSFYWSNEFLILIVVSILLARAYPPLGAEYLYPDITATWIAVCLIFFLAGLGLKTQELSKASQRIWFNLFLQVFSFGVVSSSVYGVSRALVATQVLSTDLAHGMVVTSCLPMTINMVFVLTKSSGGDEGLAIINAAAGNLLGVFLSPLLILGYLGKTSDLDVLDIFSKLAARVILPLFVGQVIQKCVPPIFNFYTKHSPAFKRVQEYTMVFIVYTVFCRTFSTESDTDRNIGDIFLMIAFVFVCLTSFMAASWYITGVIWKSEPKLRVMALFGCSHKTIAIGLPLINAIYDKHPAVGLYTLPLLTWHPMQLVIGSFLAPRLAAFVEREEAKLLSGLEGTDALSVQDNDDVNCDTEGGGMEQGDLKRSHQCVVSQNSQPENSETMGKADVPDSSLPTEETER